jgi:hypothetical protein
VILSANSFTLNNVKIASYVLNKQSKVQWKYLRHLEKFSEVINDIEKCLGLSCPALKTFFYLHIQVQM